MRRRRNGCRRSWRRRRRRRRPLPSSFATGRSAFPCPVGATAALPSGSLQIFRPLAWRGADGLAGISARLTRRRRHRRPQPPNAPRSPLLTHTFWACRRRRGSHAQLSGRRAFIRYERDDNSFWFNPVVDEHRPSSSTPGFPCNRGDIFLKLGMRGARLIPWQLREGDVFRLGQAYLLVAKVRGRAVCARLRATSPSRPPRPPPPRSSPPVAPSPPPPTHVPAAPAPPISLTFRCAPPPT